MTEGHESDYLVTVRAQVMTRDESTEGWLPLAGGGLANVSIRKRARLSPGAVGHEYIIYGERISDQDIILSCVINRDLKYYKVMPTFHHWRAGKQRNGLTFQTAADARAFDKGIIRAYTEIVDGLAKSNPSIICPPLQKYDSIGEDDVFMILDLPVETEVIKKMPSSSPEASEKSQKSASDRGERQKDTSSNKSNIENPAIHYISSETSYIQQHPTASSNTNISVSPIEQQPTIAPSENYSYVTLTAVHDYNYPVVDQPAAAQVLNARRESISALKKRNALEVAIHTQSPHTLAGTLKDPARVEVIKKNHNSFCQHCRQQYNDESNRKGACEHAPDFFRDSLEYISCMKYARGMVFHCMKDSESENPCLCASEPGCTKRWIGLTLLSLIVPCLWCYPPLHACHSIGVSCGVCGGKHEPEV